jgi:hypothetical protein
MQADKSLKINLKIPRGATPVPVRVRPWAPKELWRVGVRVINGYVMKTPTPRTPSSSMRPLPLLIFSSRWLQLPLYLGLIVAQCVYVFLFLKELYHLVSHGDCWWL